jgi:hypothetical protein
LFTDSRSIVNDFEVHSSILTIHLDAIVKLREGLSLSIGPLGKLVGVDDFVPSDSAKFSNVG